MNAEALAVIGLGVGVLMLGLPAAPESPAPDPKPDPPVPGAAIRPWDGQPLEPIAVGVPENPEISALLGEINDYLASEGVDVSMFGAREITLQRAWAKQAIPDRRLWPNIVEFYRHVWLPIRQIVGVPISTAGYRSPAYNREKDGKPRSLHQWFAGADMQIEGSNAPLAQAAAQVFAAGGPMGLGIYGSQQPGHVHGDWGGRRRTWAQTGSWL